MATWFMVSTTACFQFDVVTAAQPAQKADLASGRAAAGGTRRDCARSTPPAGRVLQSRVGAGSGEQLAHPHGTEGDQGCCGGPSALDDDQALVATAPRPDTTHGLFPIG
ncbi:hypothetical protein ACW9HJ_32335 [Nocardia gipuzkoensis]